MSSNTLEAFKTHPNNAQRVGYVLKRYPRFSETFVVNEILAHEAAGLNLEIFALRPSVDTHFQHAVADVRAAVTYLNSNTLRGSSLWDEFRAYGEQHPRLWRVLQQVDDCDALEIYQGIQLARLVESKGIDHLHAHFATSATAVTRIASLLTGVTYSLTAHAKDIFHEDVDEKQLERKLADASAVVTVSNYNAADLTRRFPRQSQQIHRIYNGLPLSQYNYRAPDDREKKIVAVGRLVEKKGFSDLISACAILHQIGLAIPCEIIGEGEFEDSLRSQIQQLELEDSVRLLGALPQREVHRIIQEASIFVAPCVTASTGDRDGLPTVILEAMALGTPCISTDVTGISEVVRHNETGLIVPERQPVKLAEEIRGLLSDVELGVKLAHSARQLIQEQFDAVENTSRLRDVFASHSVQRSKKSVSQPILAEVG